MARRLPKPNSQDRDAPLQVFLCHAFADKPRVRVLYRQLLEHGFKPWLDEEDLLPGQDWELEIPGAVRKSDVVVVCLSRRSINKDGYVQKEIRIALDVADMKPERTIFIIPAKLEECDIPSRLSRWQAVNLFREDGYSRLARSLDTHKHTGRKLKVSTRASPALQSKIYHPGGPLQVDASHYVERDSDKEVLNALRVPAFRMMVRGPVQCGKSSLLARLEHKARAVGIETAWFDPWAAVSSVSSDTQQAADIIAITAARLAKTLQIEWGLEPPNGGSLQLIEEVAPWLITALSKVAKPRLLIIDDVGSIGLEAAEEWLSFVRLIDTKTASRGVQLSVAIGMTQMFSSHFVRKVEQFSSIVHWEPRVELQWLSERETLELEHRLTGGELKLYRLFQGQPYLTHAAAMDKDFLASIERWTSTQTEKNQRAILEALPYRRHLKAIRSALLGPPWQDQSGFRNPLAYFVRMCQAKSEFGSTGDIADQNDEKFLKVAKLLNGEAEPQLDLYRLIAEDLREQTSSTQ